MLLRDAPAYRLGNDANLRHQFIELFREERLRAVGLGMIGVVMDLDHNRVGPGGHGSPRLVSPTVSVNAVGTDSRKSIPREMLVPRTRNAYPGSPELV